MRIPSSTFPTNRYAVAFCEASGPRLVRCDGNDDELIELAKQNALAIGAGHVRVLCSVLMQGLLGEQPLNMESLRTVLRRHNSHSLVTPTDLCASHRQRIPDTLPECCESGA